MKNVYFDSTLTEPERRGKLYHGSIFVFSPTPGTSELCAFGRELAEEAFYPLDPRTAHREMPVERFVAILSELKPKFIHHPRSKALLQKVLLEKGYDPDGDYFDIPRMRTSAPSDYLTSGIAYAFHPHRDTWYSAPMCQLNYWLPMYPLDPGHCMAFHPRFFSQGLKNGSAAYNYQEWMKTSRLEAAKHIHKDTRQQPKPEEDVDFEPSIRLLPPVGGMILFSGAQLHSSVPNQTGVTRLSIDFRSVNLGDVAGFKGAPNVDSDCTGTSLRDFLRIRDCERMPEELAVPYDGPIPQGKNGKT